MAPWKAGLATFGIVAAFAALLYLGLAITFQIGSSKEAPLIAWVFAFAVLGAIAFCVIGLICCAMGGIYDWFRGF